MVAFIIFWAAVFAVFFFVAGSLFKALASGFSALISSLAVILSVVFLTIVAIVILYLLYSITDGIINNGIGEVIGSIFMTIVVIGLLVACFGGLGATLLELVLVVVFAVLSLIDAILNWAADLFERGYIKSLKIILNQLEKC